MTPDWSTLDRSKIQTCTGCNVRIYAIDGAANYPVHGAVCISGSGWELESWTLDGYYESQYGGDHAGLDLDFSAATLPTPEWRDYATDRPEMVRFSEIECWTEGWSNPRRWIDLDSRLNITGLKWRYVTPVEMKP